jgi:uncharacterized RDD family membrane protein YckC
MLCPTCKSANATGAATCVTCGSLLPAEQERSSAAAVSSAVSSPVTSTVLPAAESANARAAPGSAPEAAAGGPALAGLGDRLIATVLDMIVIGAAFVVIGSWVAARRGGETAQGFDLSGRPAVIAILLSGLVAFVYYWLAEWMFGATLGKAIVSLRVRGLAGERIGPRASFIRTLARIVDAFAVYLVGYLVATFSKRRQRLGDHLAHTVVVQGPPGKAPRATALLLLTAVIVSAGFGIVGIRRAAYQSTMVAAGQSRGTSATDAASPVAIASDARLVASDAGESPPAAPTSATNSAPTGGTLALQNFKLLERENGPPRQVGPYRPNDEVYGTFDVVGGARDAQQTVDVTVQIMPLDPNGLLMLDVPWTVHVHQANPSNLPVTATFHVSLPPFVPPGTYTVHVTAHDAVANQDGEFRPTFTVDAPKVAPGDHLEVRDFRLAATSDGPALAAPIYQAGQTVYLAFRVFGVRFKDNRPDLHVDLAVLSPTGATLLGKQDWINEQEALAYHPPSMFFPVDSYVTLPATMAKGTYTQQFTITDKVANTTIVHRAPFEVK